MIGPHTRTIVRPPPTRDGAVKRIKLVLVAALISGACSGAGSDPLGAMQLQRTSEGGAVTVARGDETLEVDDEFDLEPGDVIMTSKDATATLRLGGEGQTVSLGPSARVEVIDEGEVDAQAGSVLVSAGEPTEVAFGDARAAASGGVFRLDRTTTTTRLGTYSGSVSVTSPGEERATVERLFQVSVAAGDVSPPRPYQLDTTDAWDRERLGDVADLDQDLERLSAAFANQIRGEEVGLEFVRNVTGLERVGFVKSYLDRPPVDVLVASAIAGEVRRPLPRAFRGVLELREQNGSWGVIAAIERVKGRALIASVEEMFQGTGAFAASASEETSDSGGDDGSTGDGSGSPGTTPPGGGGGGDGPGTSPSPSPSPSPSDEECNGDVVECAVDDILPEIPGLPL